MKTKLEQVSPAKAKRYSKKNIHNRRYRPAHAKRMALDMKHGAWVQTHQGIAFDAAGNLVDGQHRLAAIEISGCTIPMLVTTGLPLEQGTNGHVVKTMDTVDQGAARSVADQLSLSHGQKNSIRFASACKTIALLCTGKLAYRMTVAQVIAIREIYREEVESALDLLKGKRSARGGNVVGVVSFACKSHALESIAFATDLGSGVGLKERTPVLALSKWLENSMGDNSGSALARQQLRERVANAIVASIQGRRITNLKVGTNGIDFLLNSQKKNVKLLREILV